MCIIKSILLLVLSVNIAICQDNFTGTWTEEYPYWFNSTGSSSEEDFSQTKLGGYCSYYQNRPCAIEGSFCRREMCSCLPSHVQDLSKNECLLKANKTGDPCEFDTQCSTTLSGNGKCGASKTCICVEGSVPNSDDTECLMGDKYPGEECSNSMGCYGYPDKSECLNAVCQCRSGFTAASNSNSSENGTLGCLPVVDRTGDECIDRNQCKEGSLGKWSDCLLRKYSYRYNSKECTCPENTIEISLVYGESETCYKKADKLGDSCEIDLQCHYNLGRDTECSPDGVCACSSNAIPTTDGLRCLPTSVSIGDYCQLDSQCVGKPNVSSACSESEVCLCKEGFTPNANLTDCLPIREKLGESCIDVGQCIPVGEKIGCLEHSWKKESGEKVCRCEDGYINEPGKNKCYWKARNEYDDCEVDAQCIPALKRSRCVSRKCRCFGGAVSKYVSRNGTYKFECTS